MLEKHLTDPDNKIAQIIKGFYQNLYRSYGSMLPKETKKNYRKGSKNNVNVN